MTFKQIWPPQDAYTFVALRTMDDSRDGWVRWTWLPGEPLALVTGYVEEMLADRPVMPWTDPQATYAWALRQGWGYVSDLDGPPAEEPLRI